MQACTHPPKILILRISRFRAEDGSTLKLHTRVAIPCQVHIPCYREVGPACDLVMYTIVACILHCGATSQAGHYTTRFIDHLPSQAAPHAPPQWKADDSKPIEPVKNRADERRSTQSTVLRHSTLQELMTECRGTRLWGARKQHALRKLQKNIKKLPSAAHRSMAPNAPYPLTLFAGTAK